MPTLSRIAPEIPASDLRRSIDFYEKVLGFRLAMQMPDGAYAIVERDAIAIHLFRADGDRPGTVGLHIFTPELDALRDELLTRGADLSQDIERKPWGNRDFRVVDPAGNEIKFTEPLADER